MEKGAEWRDLRDELGAPVLFRGNVSPHGYFKSDLDLPPSPTSLSALRIAYTAVKVLTMICHGVKLPGGNENRLMLWWGLRTHGDAYSRLVSRECGVRVHHPT
jgi:hypothetical protein